MYPDTAIVFHSRDACCFPVLFICSFVAERKLLIPRLGMLLVSGNLGTYTMRLAYMYDIQLSDSLHSPQLFSVLGLLGMFGNQVGLTTQLQYIYPLVVQIHTPGFLVGLRRC